MTAGGWEGTRGKEQLGGLQTPYLRSCWLVRPKAGCFILSYTSQRNSSAGLAQGLGVGSDQFLGRAGVKVQARRLATVRGLGLLGGILSLGPGKAPQESSQVE